ncbi:hypothetical protein KAR34_01980 [bacterium]|nr:hypothetical protein [bacterium]
MRSRIPIISEIDLLDTNVLNLALHEYKNQLKQRRATRRKKELYERLNRMIALVNLMM